MSCAGAPGIGAAGASAWLRFRFCTQLSYSLAEGKSTCLPLPYAADPPERSQSTLDEEANELLAGCAGVSNVPESDTPVFIQSIMLSSGESDTPSSGNPKPSKDGKPSDAGELLIKLSPDALSNSAPIGADGAGGVASKPLVGGAAEPSQSYVENGLAGSEAPGAAGGGAAVASRALICWVTFSSPFLARALLGLIASTFSRQICCSSSDPTSALR